MFSIDYQSHRTLSRLMLGRVLVTNMILGCWTMWQVLSIPASKGYLWPGGFFILPSHRNSIIYWWRCNLSILVLSHAFCLLSNSEDCSDTYVVPIVSSMRGLTYQQQLQILKLNLRSSWMQRWSKQPILRARYRFKASVKAETATQASTCKAVRAT